MSARLTDLPAFSIQQFTDQIRDRAAKLAEMHRRIRTCPDSQVAGILKRIETVQVDLKGLSDLFAGCADPLAADLVEKVTSYTEKFEEIIQVSEQLLAAIALKDQLEANAKFNMLDLLKWAEAAARPRPTAMEAYKMAIESMGYVLGAKAKAFPPEVAHRMLSMETMGIYTGPKPSGIPGYEQLLALARKTFHSDVTPKAVHEWLGVLVLDHGFTNKEAESMPLERAASLLMTPLPKGGSNTSQVAPIPTNAAPPPTSTQHTGKQNDEEPKPPPGAMVRFCKGRLLCSPDFGVIQRGDTTFEFLGNVRAVIKYMIENHNRCERIFTKQELLDAAESTASYVSDVFKNNSAWNNLIVLVKGQRGMYTLQCDASTLDDPEQNPSSARVPPE